MNSEKKTRSVVDIIKAYAASEKTNLPVFPGVAFELQQLLADDNTSVDQVAKVIGKDQTLSIQVLKLANSALFSGPSQVRTIKDATMRLGLNHVFNLVVCTSQQNMYKSSNPTLNKHLQTSWKHALCAAIGAKWLVQELGSKQLKDEAFLAGLLHDIGKLILIKVLEKMNSKNEDLVFSNAFISKVLVSMHPEQGYELMDEWGIPETYCKIARDHHEEIFDPDDVLLMAVRVVNHVCRAEGLSTNPDPELDLKALPEVRALGIGSDALDELRAIIAESTTPGFNG
ncbi:MAG: HDOD domain-containing protein [Syntrophobacter sp.]